THVRIEISDVGVVGGQLIFEGYDVLRGSVGNDSFELIVTGSELEELAVRGLTPVVIAVSRPFKEIQAERQGDGGSGEMSIMAEPAAVPEGYPELDEVLARMAAAANNFPNICQMVDLTERYDQPTTWDGRHMYVVKISDNVALDEDEPAQLVVSCHHAREIVTPLVGLYAIEYFTTLYGVNSTVTALVDEYEIWIAPIWNPDGYVYVFEENNMWRKNRRQNGPDPASWGVDQNRNYPFGWETECGGSTDMLSLTYRGPEPASEPETQTMIAWSEDRRFAKVLDFHSYGRYTICGYNSCWVHPFLNYWSSEAGMLASASGYFEDSVAQGGIFGEHFMWQQAYMGAHSFLTEIALQFQPTYAEAVAEKDMVFPSIITQLERPIPLSGHVTDVSTGLPLAAEIGYPQTFFSGPNENSSGGRFGRYHVFLPGGSHIIRFSAEGYISQSHVVNLTTYSAQTLDVALVPAKGPLKVEGYYKEVFMDSGIGLSQYSDLPAADYLELDWEYLSLPYLEADSEDYEIQERVIIGSVYDDNGRLLYPDGAPRFRCVQVQGGSSHSHGVALGVEGRQRFIDFVAAGGSYNGTCAGFVLAALNRSDRGTTEYPYYLHLWPGVAVFSGITSGQLLNHTIPDDSPLLQYFDYGGDQYISSLYNNYSSYAIEGDPVYWYPGTEALMLHDFPGHAVDGNVSSLAYKQDADTGRLTVIGSHPEHKESGELRDLMAALLWYAMDGNGVARVKSALVKGAEREMNDNSVTGYEKIGDKQYHHFTVEVPAGTLKLTVSLEGDNGYDLNLYARKGDFAFAGEEGVIEAVNGSGSDESISIDDPGEGIWYIGVKGCSTVSTALRPWGQEYTGNLEVLNGQAYTISARWYDSEVGILSIDTFPVKGEVLVNGVSWGAAPQSGEIEFGMHTVSYGAMGGYVTPPDQPVIVAIGQTTPVTGTYIPATGTLSIDTTPGAAEVFIDGVSQGYSPVSKPLATGTYTVSFGVVADYISPATRQIMINTNQTTSVTGTYLRATGALSIDTDPIKGELFVDGTSWGSAPQNQLIETGTHTVSFGAVANYLTPAPQTITVLRDQTLTVTATYPPATGTLSITTSPVTGEIFVDDVSWGSAPQTREITLGSHAIGFGYVEGYITPDDQTVTVTQSQATTAEGVYELLALPLPIDKLTVKSSKLRTPPADSVTLSGRIDPAGLIKLSKPGNDHIDASICIVHDTGTTIFGHLETLDPDQAIISAKRDAIKYSNPAPEGAAGHLTSFKLDRKKAAFTLKAQNIDLSGLHSPVKVQ
ncbi:MAG: PEGA domain-containing protein, partial [Planctomycetes bacterium]|nr:PEGA domain-containing protein [Planctomycetota bacterium]